MIKNFKQISKFKFPIASKFPNFQKFQANFQVMIKNFKQISKFLKISSKFPSYETEVKNRKLSIAIVREFLSHRTVKKLRRK